MQDDAPDPMIAEGLVMALGEALIRKGFLDGDDMTAAADRANDGTARGGMIAHLLNCINLNAQAPTLSDWQAEQRRKRMRVVDGGVADGGNEGP